MSRERLQQLDEVAQLLRLRLQNAQMQAAILRRDVDQAQRRFDATSAERNEIEAGWRGSLGDGRGLDLETISAWRALAGAAEARRRAAEQALEHAYQALRDFGRELIRHQSLSERGDAVADRERSVVARKHEDKSSNAILERHNALGEVS